MDRDERSIVEISDQKPPRSLFDGLSNLVTGLGGEKDKSSYNVWTYSGKNFDYRQLIARFREDWLSQKVCTIIPQDLTREWRVFSNKLGKEADRAFQIAEVFRVAHKWSRLLGTCYVVIDVDDGRATDKPINWKNLKTGCLRSLQVVDRTRMVAIGDVNQVQMSPDFGMPEFYQFVNTPTPIHKDRIIRFEGTELPIYDMQRNNWCSDSILLPLMGQMDNFHVASQAAAQMVQEANVDIISIEGLQDILTEDQGTEAMLSRFASWKQMKSVFNVSLVDASEIVEQKKMQLSGVKDLIWEYLKVVAASVSIPATRFLSASPDGMNATGESDQVNYIETLQGMHKSIYDPRLEVVDALLIANYGLPEDAMDYEWACIFPESAGEKSERFKTHSEALGILVTAGILDPNSALDEAKEYGTVSETAKVGQMQTSQIEKQRSNANNV